MIATRSNEISRMEDYEITLKNLCKCFEAEYTREALFGGWSSSNEESMNLIKLFEQSHEELFDFEPKKYTVHAGLEVGVLLEKYPKWCPISIGPQINNAHSTNEEVELDTIEPFYNWLKRSVEKLII